MLTPEEQQELEMLEQEAYSRGILQPGQSVADVQRQPGLIERLEQSAPIQFALGAGDVLANIPRAAYATLTGEEYRPIQTGAGTAYQVGEFAGEIAPWLIPGPHQATLPARMATAMGAGALMSPGESMEGAIEAGKWAALGEALVPAGKGIKHLSEKFTRAGLVDEVSKKISQQFKQAKKEAYGIVDPLFEKYGNTKLSRTLQDQLEDRIQPYLRYLSTGKKGQREVYKTFKENPTIENLQKVQSEFGSVSRSLDRRQPGGLELGNKLDSLRDDMKNVVRNTLDMFEPGSSDKYNQFLREYAEGPGSFEYSKLMSNLARGKTEGVSASRLKSELAKGIEGEFPAVPAEHFYRQLLPEVAGKLQRTELYNLIAGALGGAAAGGPFGAVGGALAPRALQTLGPAGGGELLQQALSEQLSKAYPYARQAMVGAAAAPERAEEIY